MVKESRGDIAITEQLQERQRGADFLKFVKRLGLRPGRGHLMGEHCVVSERSDPRKEGDTVSLEALGSLGGGGESCSLGLGKWLFFSPWLSFPCACSGFGFCRCSATVKRAWSAGRYSSPSSGSGQGAAVPVLAALTAPSSLLPFRNPVTLVSILLSVEQPRQGGEGLPRCLVGGGELWTRDGSLSSSPVSLSAAALIGLCCSRPCPALWLHRKVWGSPRTPQGAAQTGWVPALPAESAAWSG